MSFIPSREFRMSFHPGPGKALDPVRSKPIIVC